MEMINQKIIGISIPCYNEEENVIPLYYAITELFAKKLSNYQFLVQFIDNCSSDKTRANLEFLCSKYANVRAIFNSRNYQGYSALHGLLEAEGDCVVYLSADFQDPVDKIYDLIEKWEKDDNLIVVAQKESSSESRFIYSLRSMFYKIIKTFSTTGFIEHFCNFGLYDRKFLEILKSMEKPNYSIRGNVAEFGYNIGYISYEQEKRRSGKSNYNLWRYLNLAITNFVDYTNILIRIATIVGALTSIISLMTFIAYCIIRLGHREKLVTISFFCIILCVFSSIIIFMLGFVGEYVLANQRKIDNSSLVIEEKRIGFASSKEE